MKRWLISILSLAALTGLIAGNFMFPVSANALLTPAGDIKTIAFDYLNEGKVEHFQIANLSKEERKAFEGAFRDYSFHKRLGSTNIRNDGKTLLITIILADNRNYRIDINEKGYAVSHDKKYKTDPSLFARLSEWLMQQAAT